MPNLLPNLPNLLPNLLAKTDNSDTTTCSDFTSSLVESQKKRFCSGSHALTAVTLQGSPIHLQSIMTSFKKEVVSEITELLSKSNVSEKKVEKVCDSNQKVIEAIQGAVTIEVLKLILKANGFT